MFFEARIRVCEGPRGAGTGWRGAESTSSLTFDVIHTQWFASAAVQPVTSVPGQSDWPTTDPTRTHSSSNSVLSALPGVKAMTDVTGFGLLGHLTELCEGSGVSATIDSTAVPRLPNIDYYIAEDCTPGGTDRNFESYGHHLSPLTDAQRALLCDPQTSGGLLVAVAPDGLDAFHEATGELNLKSFGQLTGHAKPLITVN